MAQPPKPDKPKKRDKPFTKDDRYEKGQPPPPQEDVDMEDEHGLDRRGWQLKLKTALKPVQYALVEVQEFGSRYRAVVLDPDTRAPTVTVVLDDPFEAPRRLARALADARPPRDQDVTILPHAP